MSRILPPAAAARVFAALAVGYAMSYGLRSVNAAIAPELVAELGLSHAALGGLTGQGAQALVDRVDGCAGLDLFEPGRGLGPDMLGCGRVFEELLEESGALQCRVGGAAGDQPGGLFAGGAHRPGWSLRGVSR